MAIKEIWPEDKPISLRVSATDYREDGIDVNEMVEIVNMVRKYIDIIHVSSGGVEAAPIRTFPGYQVKLAEIIKRECGLPTIAVGLISHIDQVEEILNNERSDLVALGRELLRSPYWVLNAAHENGIEVDFPAQYKRAFK